MGSGSPGSCPLSGGCGPPNPAGNPGLAGSWGCPIQRLWSLPDSHPSLWLVEFMKSPQGHKSCWELLSALSNRQQAAEQGFPCPCTTRGPGGCARAAPSPQIGSVSGQAPRGAGWVGPGRQTPGPFALSPPAPPWRPESSPDLSQRAGYWAPEPARSCQASTFTESRAWG